MDEVLLIAIGIGWAVGTPILAIVALVRTGGLRAENARLAAEIAALRRQIEQGVDGGGAVVARQDAALHHHPVVLLARGTGDVGQRIAVHHQEVGDVAFADAAVIAQPH